MFITIESNLYKLSTTLGVTREIEKKYKIPVMQIFPKLGEALTDELVDIVCIAAGKVDAKNGENKDFRQAIFNEWDYTDLLSVVQELVARLMFSGTPEQNEIKLAKFPGSEELKNVLRGFLGMPIPQQSPESAESTGSNL